MPVEEGKVAPAFTLSDPTGAKVALKDYRGKNVIVYFYPRDTSTSCRSRSCPIPTRRS